MLRFCWGYGVGCVVGGVVGYVKVVLVGKICGAPGLSQGGSIEKEKWKKVKTTSKEYRRKPFIFIVY